MSIKLTAPEGVEGFSFNGVPITIEADRSVMAPNQAIADLMLSHGFQPYEMTPEERKVSNEEVAQNNEAARLAHQVSDTPQMRAAAAVADAANAKLKAEQDAQEEADLKQRQAIADAAKARGEEPPPVTVRIPRRKLPAE